MNLEDMECIRYLGVDVIVDGTMKAEVTCKEEDGVKVFGRENKGLLRHR